MTVFYIAHNIISDKQNVIIQVIIIFALTFSAIVQNLLCALHVYLSIRLRILTFDFFAPYKYSYLLTYLLK